MNKPLACDRRRALASALLAAFGSAPGLSAAVYESPDHVGQVLIYPYYTVQSAAGNSFNTYLSVVNNTAKAKALKVRFREGKNGREALGFNLFLSPNDVWTAAVGAADATSASPASIVTGDKSCTMPPLPAGGMAFNNFLYTGAAADGGPASLDRTREGYIEIIEMATLTGALATSVTHTSVGTPANCAAVQVNSALITPPITTSMTPPTGGLSGTYVLINVANGQSFSGNATALAQFSDAVLFSDPGVETPNLGSATPPFATTISRSPVGQSGSGLTLYGATYANGRDAVSATLMRSGLVNEYVLDLPTRSATDWIVTFPTKVLHVVQGAAATPPFSANFASGGACESISLTYFNREEAGAPDPCGGGCGVLPPQPVYSLCYSASVLTPISNPATMTASAVFGSTNFLARPVNGYANGWSGVYFSGTAASTVGLGSAANAGKVVNLSTGASTSATTVNLRGLPAIGFMARTLNNGLLSCTTFGGSAGVCAGSYGALVDHRSFTTATPTP